MAEQFVHLIDDEESFRRSASFLLRKSGFEVRVWSSGDDFLKDLRALRHGCILLDLSMPGADGMEVLATLIGRGIQLPVIMLSGHGDIPMAVRAMKNGAVDFLQKPFERGALLAALHAGFDRLANACAADLQRADAQRLLAALTERELEILRRLANGAPNKMIAYDLGISSRTVEVHRAHAMAKLNARSFPDALRVAFAAGLHRAPE